VPRAIGFHWNENQNLGFKINFQSNIDIGCEDNAR
jgi:hypothetical protein